jgi:hypothetical protein
MSVGFVTNRGAEIASGVAVSLTTNVEQVFRDMDAYVDDVLSVAAPRALNKLRDQAKTAGFRKISDLYGIGPRTMDQYESETSAHDTTLQATINVKGKGFPLSAFQPRQTALGVSVLIKGVRQIIAHTFLATMPNGHVGVFARGTYGKSFIFGRGQHKKTSAGKWTELPINELYSFAPPDAFGNPQVVDAMQSRVDQQAPIVLKQEIRFAAT